MTKRVSTVIFTKSRNDVVKVLVYVADGKEGVYFPGGEMKEDDKGCYTNTAIRVLEEETSRTWSLLGRKEEFIAYLAEGGKVITWKLDSHDIPGNYFPGAFDEISPTDPGNVNQYMWVPAKDLVEKRFVEFDKETRFYLNGRERQCLQVAWWQLKGRSYYVSPTTLIEEEVQVYKDVLFHLDKCSQSMKNRLLQTLLDEKRMNEYK